MKATYIALMDRVLDAYSLSRILDYFDRVKKNRITEHGFPRLTANLGILIAHGRRQEYAGLFLEMMDYCCESFLIPKCPNLGNDFSVKEIIFCLMEVEQAGCVPREKTAYWRSLLAKINPVDCYTKYALSPDEIHHNWALFTGVSEFMRQYIGIADTAEAVDIQIATQLPWLDENGMYRDPGNPMVYDLVPRGLFSVLMHFGYKGKFREEIDACLRKTGLLTLNMQSVTGEIPYGGRSHQFIHNETQLALILEFEANRYYAEGNTKLAGQFKTGVRKAVENIAYWLRRERLTHIKNNYPIESGYGCEDYSYFDKYMVTTASFLYVAYLFCNDAIAEYPLSSKPLAFSLSNDFHKTFLKNQNWFVEFDTQADLHYDASGIGRIHRAGMPSALCLSIPGTATPDYFVDSDTPEHFAITVGIPAGDSLLFATGEAVSYTKTAESATENTAFAGFVCDFGDGRTASLSCQVTPETVILSAEAAEEVAFMLPAFAYDGSSHTEISCTGTVLEIRYQGYVCRYVSSSPILDSGKIGYNRNGQYRLFHTVGKQNISVTVEMESV